ncbi:MAG TPA: flagellar motor switch protein FliN [Bacteroidota bacterium]
MADMNVQDTRSPEEIEAKRAMEEPIAQKKGAEYARPRHNDFPREGQSAEFQPVESAPSDTGSEKKLGFLMDMALPVSIELGRMNLTIQDILDLERGQVVEFEKLASEPVDILVNGKKMAEGEVVVIENHFGVRLTQIGESSEGSRRLRK